MTRVGGEGATPSRRAHPHGDGRAWHVPCMALPQEADVPQRPSKRPATGKRAAGTKRSAPTRRATAQKRGPASKRAKGPKRAKKTTRKRAAGSPVSARRKNAARAAASRSSRRTRTTTPPSTLASATAAVKGAVAGAVAAVAGRLPWTSGEPDALTLLETDHRRFEALLDKGAATTARAVKGRREILATLTAALNVHELIEEQLLYPTLQAHPEAKDIVLEGYQEHHVADLLLKELHDLAVSNDQWSAKFKVLKESLTHHIQEEEGTMFRLARGVLDRDELHELGKRVAVMKAEQA